MNCHSLEAYLNSRSDSELLILYNSDVDQETQLFIEDILERRGVSLPPNIDKRSSLLFFS